MLTNADVTVYRLETDAATHTESWVKTVIRGVCWQEEAAIQPENGGARDAGLTKIYIPRLSWSSSAPPCRPEDRVAKGVRQGTAPPADALAVTGVSNKDMGRNVRHWAVAAV